MNKKWKRLLILNLPFAIIGLLATNVGEAWRLSEGKDISEKIFHLADALNMAFSNPLPSLHPKDLLTGMICGLGLKILLILKSQEKKNYKKGIEYGSARWGTAKDIEPFMDPVFENNIILTQTERLMMSNRPSNPMNARNKNVLVVGGSGSGKTRFFIKPNMLQCNSKKYPVSFVVTDPKGSLIHEIGHVFEHYH